MVTPNFRVSFRIYLGFSLLPWPSRHGPRSPAPLQVTGEAPHSLAAYWVRHYTSWCKMKLKHGFFLNTYEMPPITQNLIFRLDVPFAGAQSKFSPFDFSFGQYVPYDPTASPFSIPRFTSSMEIIQFRKLNPHMSELSVVPTSPKTGSYTSKLVDGCFSLIRKYVN